MTRLIGIGAVGQAYSQTSFVPPSRATSQSAFTYTYKPPPMSFEYAPAETAEEATPTDVGPGPETEPTTVEPEPDVQREKKTMMWVIGGILAAVVVLGGITYAVVRKKKKSMTPNRRRKLSPKAQRFVSRKIEVLRREGYGPKQSAAIAYSMARKKGYKVPRRRRRRK